MLGVNNISAGEKQRTQEISTLTMRQATLPDIKDDLSPPRDSPSAVCMHTGMADNNFFQIAVLYCVSDKTSLKPQLSWSRDAPDAPVKPSSNKTCIAYK
jgi:hypothetical protein